MIKFEGKREAFRQETINNWEHFHATGRHLRMDEADAWLKKLERGEDLEPPECHD